MSTNSDTTSHNQSPGNDRAQQSSTGFSTASIHGGLSPDPSTGAILTPIFQSTTFAQDAVGVHKGYTYTRAANPTVAALERNLGFLEGRLPAVAFSTGMAAISATFLSFLKAGDKIIVSDVVYGGTVRLLRQILSDFGVRAQFVDTSNLTLLKEALHEEPVRLVLIETPANPTLKLTDIRAVVELAHESKALVAVDNTFLTPALQNCLDLGADLVIYSTTKYLEGHNSTVGGAVLSNDKGLLDRLRIIQKSIGFAQSPFESWLTLRGIKTLSIRMKQHCENALSVAKFLESHPVIESVNYPFLSSFPQYDLARKQQKLGGGMISFELKGGVEAGLKLMKSVQLITLAENLGAVESLITHPATMTHGPIPAEERQRLGITDGLIRLSVGLEDSDDLIQDLDRALSAVDRKTLIQIG